MGRFYKFSEKLLSTRKILFSIFHVDTKATSWLDTGWMTVKLAVSSIMAA